MNNLINKFDRQEIIEVDMNSNLAEEYLRKYAHFKGQRPIKNQRINMHTDTITDGLFIGSQIVIGCYHENEDHRTVPISALIDGHHRLYAIASAQTNDPIQIQVNKIYAPKKIIRELYGKFDNKKSARSLEDILRWRVSFHDEISERWNYDYLVKFALALPYASGHYFAVGAGKKVFTFNALPKGVTMSKDDFLSESLDVRTWWNTFDLMEQFIDSLKDRENYGMVSSQFGNVIYGVFLKSFKMIDIDRSRQTLNKTLDFWKAVADGAQDSGNNFVNTPNLIKKMWKVVADARREENLGKVGKGASTIPIFYVLSQAHKRWMSDRDNLGISYATVKDKTGKNIIEKFFSHGQTIYPIHPVYKENRYLEG